MKIFSIKDQNVLDFITFGAPLMTEPRLDTLRIFIIYCENFGLFY